MVAAFYGSARRRQLYRISGNDFFLAPTKQAQACSPSIWETVSNWPPHLSQDLQTSAMREWLLARCRLWMPISPQPRGRCSSGTNRTDSAPIADRKARFRKQAGNAAARRAGASISHAQTLSRLCWPCAAKIVYLAGKACGLPDSSPVWPDLSNRARRWSRPPCVSLKKKLASTRMRRARNTCLPNLGPSPLL